MGGAGLDHRAAVARRHSAAAGFIGNSSVRAAVNTTDMLAVIGVLNSSCVVHYLVVIKGHVRGPQRDEKKAIPVSTRILWR